MAAQLDEEQKLDEIVERRKIDGSFLKLEVMQKVPEPVLQERRSQGKRVKKGEGSEREKKIVPGWSVEDMKEKPNIAVEEQDTEEMRKWRGLSQSEMDPLLEEFWREEWKRKSWTSRRSKRAKERPSEVGVPPWSGGGCAKTRNSE